MQAALSKWAYSAFVVDDGAIKTASQPAREPRHLPVPDSLGRSSERKMHQWPLPHRGSGHCSDPGADQLSIAPSTSNISRIGQMGKGLLPATLVAGAGFEPATSGL